MIHLKFAIPPLFISTMLLGSVFISSLGLQKAIATTTNTTTTVNVTGGTNQSGAVGAAVDNNTNATAATLTKKLNVVTSVSPITNIVKNVGW